MGYKRLLRRLVNLAGYEVTNFGNVYRVCRTRKHPLGVDWLFDVRSLTRSIRKPRVFDVGANVGQTTTVFARALPGAEIHCFEPSSEAFEKLAENTRGYSGLKLNKVAVGADNGRRVLEINSNSTLTSFLTLRPECAWGQVKGVEEVVVTTLDSYVRDNAIEYVHVLKTDTQGFELDVLKGAAGLLGRRAIKLVLLEVILDDMYAGQSLVEDIFAFLRRCGLRLVALYDFRMSAGGYASYADGLFLDPLFGR